jgi:ketosteroid isomerase-like protein
MRRLAFAALSLAVVLLPACAPPKAQSSAEIAARDEAWEQAFNAGDASKVAAIYTEDARLLAPNAKVSQGRATVEEAFAQMIATGHKITLDSTEAMAAGDLGYSIGTYEEKDKDGAVVDSGKYVEIFRRVGGEWQISNDIWNSDQPAAAGGNLIITHAVKDDAQWLAAWQGEPSRREDFARHGAPSVRIFASPDHPGEHALLVDVTDMDDFTAWLSSDEGAELKKKDGVIDKGMMVFTPVQ